MDEKKSFKSIICAAIVVFILIATVGATSALPVGLPEVIDNYYYDPEIPIDNLNIKHKWSGDEESSGEITNSIAIQDSSISFKGYEGLPFFDAIFTDTYQLNSLRFEISPTGLNPNGIIRTGFWVNASISADNKITGYMVTIGSTELTSIKRDSSETKISLFYVENFDITSYNKTLREAAKNKDVLPDSVIELVNDYGIAADKDYFLPIGATLLETYYGTDIDFTNGISFQIESSDSSFEVYMFINGQFEMLFEKVVTPNTGRGFGLYTQHGGHNCKESVCMQYNSVYLRDVAYTTAEVNFKLSGTETTLAESQMQYGFPEQKYKITPPNIDGYKYIGSSRESLDPILYEENSYNNITDLFYVAETTKFVYPPPNGPDITPIFHIVDGVEINSYIDEGYQNVAVITPDQTDQFGGMWAKEKLNLYMPFKTKMFIHLGHEKDKIGDLADGMTFVMHNDKNGLNAIGGRGEGLGAYTGRVVSGGQDKNDGKFLGNSLVIEFDTKVNRYTDEKNPYPMYDPKKSGFPAHCSLIIPRNDYIKDTPDANGYNGHMNTYYFFDYSQDKQSWLEFEVEWTPFSSGNNVGGVLSYTFNRQQMSYTINNINAIFGGNEVYWGFTGSTGSLSALQAAAITKLPTQEPSSKKVSANSPGVGGAPVKVGDLVTYDIYYINSSGKTAELKITDTLPAGLEYVKATNEKNIELTEYTKDDRTINWTIPDIGIGKSGTVTITARVTEDADTIVKNVAKLEWRNKDGNWTENVEAENSVIPRKTVTITFVDGEGSPIKETFNERVNKDTEYPYSEPYIDGYIFDSWKLNDVLQDSYPINFIVTDNTTVTLVYDKTAEFSFYKVNLSNSSEKLTGAEFKLYLWGGTGDAPDELVPIDLTSSDWSLIETKTSVDNGLVNFKNLRPGIYQLVETRTPTGYQLPLGEWRFTIDNKGVINILPCVGENKPPAIKINDADEVPYLIGNVKQYILPELGSSSNNMNRYLSIGIFMLIVAVILSIIMYLHKKRGKKFVKKEVQIESKD